MRKTSCVTVVVMLAAVGALGAGPPATASYAKLPTGPDGWTPDGPVHAVVSTDSAVYVGGAFTGGVAALTTDGISKLWTAEINGPVRALALSSDGTHLVAGGTFTEADGARHRKLAKLSTSNGESVPGWKASVGGRVRDIAVNGDTAYFGGAFTKHNGIEQRGLGAVSVVSGAAVENFRTSTNARVFALDTSASRLFLAGDFTRVNGRVRHSLASVTLAGHSLDTWKPARPCTKCNLYWDIDVNHANTLFAVGRNAAAVTAVNASTGARRWRTGANGDAQALGRSQGLLYVGGHFSRIRAKPRKTLAALNPRTGKVNRAFRPNFVGTYPGIWALAANGSMLNVGGHFTAAGPTPPKRYPYFAMFPNT